MTKEQMELAQELAALWILDNKEDNAEELLNSLRAETTYKGE